MFRVLLQFLVTAVVLVCGPVLFAQTDPTTVPAAEVPQALEELKSKAIVVHIGAKITKGTEVLWSAEQTRITVHGLSVSIQMQNENLLITTEITPYRLEDDRVLLVIKSDLWRHSTTDQKVQYIASLRSARIDWGEVVYFYPLGRATVEDKPRVEMEISLSQYRNTKE